MENSTANRYLLDLPEMDTQHSYLYNLFDRLEQSSHVVNTSKTKYLLKEIERYILFHFSSEEHLMRSYDFPHYAIHQSDHEQLEMKLARYFEDFDAGQLNPLRLKGFLSSWLSEHSEISDMQYVKWIKSLREEI